MAESHWSETDRITVIDPILTVKGTYVIEMTKETLQYIIKLNETAQKRRDYERERKRKDFHPNGVPVRKQISDRLIINNPFEDKQ